MDIRCKLNWTFHYSNSHNEIENNAEKSGYWIISGLLFCFWLSLLVSDVAFLAAAAAAEVSDQCAAAAAAPSSAQKVLRSSHKAIN